MVFYVNAKEGKRFVPTIIGLETNKVRTKFEVNSPNYRQYCKQVPKSWLERGYVSEVDE